MKFSYKAVTQDGKTVEGILDAQNKRLGVQILRNRQLIPIRLVENNTKSFSTYLPFKKSSSQDLIFFTRQLSSMLTAGLTLVQSLGILKDQVQNSAMGDVVRTIIADIEEGRTFWQSIGKHDSVFSPIYISLIRAAETSGVLDKILVRLAENLEKQQKIRDTIRSALIYPVIIIIGMGGVMVVMMVVVVPQLALLYKQLNIELPLSTRVVIALSDLLIHLWPLLIAGVVLIMFFVRYVGQLPPGKRFMDTIVLKLPVFGKLTRESILTEITRTVGLLVGSGSLVIEAFKQTADVAGNVLYRDAMIAIAEKIEKGVTVGESIGSSSLFPNIVAQMAKIGEQTGKLDESFTKISEYFEREVDQTVKTLTAALEPLIMVVLGISVGFLIISIVTPIYSLVSAIH